MSTPDFQKMGGLIPAIVQDQWTGRVLMLGYMNEVSWAQTLETGKVTFYSRSRSELWVKGATSGNYLHLKSWSLDCDQDSLLLQVDADGPTCHKGSISCFEGESQELFLLHLSRIIQERKLQMPANSYTTSLFQKGVKKIAQKVGEESVELILEAESGAIEDFKNETADMLFHLLVLLEAKGLSIKDIDDVLKHRHGG
jgi:phosphoribosyl-ATP pyrophosphohydrolase/phosphoribosyl-AMP cyclohydrolase